MYVYVVVWVDEDVDETSVPPVVEFVVLENHFTVMVDCCPPPDLHVVKVTDKGDAATPLQ